jgi:hypothetical protein
VLIIFVRQQEILKKFQLDVEQLFSVTTKDFLVLSLYGEVSWKFINSIV